MKVPKLTKEAFYYLNHIDNMSEKEASDEETKEFLTHMLNEDNEAYIGFIAAVDTLSRKCKLFRRVSVLHHNALKTSDQYYKRYKEIITPKTKLNNLNAELNEWSKANRRENDMIDGSIFKIV